MSDKQLVKQLFLSSNYWVLNKEVVKLFGIETAFLLSSFAEAEQILGDKEGWFYQTSDTVEDMTTLTRHKQDQCIAKLEEYKVLSKDIRGMPAKRYFKINYDRVSNLIVNSQQTRLSKSNKLDCKKSATSKELSNKEIINKDKPSFHKEREIFDYYISKDIIKHKRMTGEMRSRITTALRKHSVEELKKIIDNYDEIYRSNKYFFNTKYSLIDLMRAKDLRQFSDEYEPYVKFLVDKKVPVKKASSSVFDQMEALKNEYARND